MEPVSFILFSLMITGSLGVGALYLCKSNNTTSTSQNHSENKNMVEDYKKLVHTIVEEQKTIRTKIQEYQSVLKGLFEKMASKVRELKNDGSNAFFDKKPSLAQPNDLFQKGLKVNELFKNTPNPSFQQVNEIPQLTALITAHHEELKAAAADFFEAVEQELNENKAAHHV